MNTNDKNKLQSIKKGLHIALRPQGCGWPEITQRESEFELESDPPRWLLKLPGVQKLNERTIKVTDVDAFEHAIWRVDLGD